MLGNARVGAVLVAVDLERAKRFYTKTLGLKTSGVNSEDGTLMLDAGSRTGLVIYPSPGPSKAEHTQAAFQVEDVEATVDELTKRGVVFEQYDQPGLKTDERGIAAIGDAVGAWFKDSEGNIIAVVKM